MGADLTLIVPTYPHNKDWFSPTHMDLCRYRDLWETIRTIPAIEVPEPVSCHMAIIEKGDNAGEHCWGETKEDPYGSPLMYVKAGDLAALKDHEGVTGKYVNAAAWAYICALPKDWPIVLYWH